MFLGANRVFGFWLDFICVIYVALVILCLLFIKSGEYDYVIQIRESYIAEGRRKIIDKIPPAKLHITQSVVIHVFYSHFIFNNNTMGMFFRFLLLKRKLAMSTHP